MMYAKIFLFALLPLGTFVLTIGAANFKPEPEGILDNYHGRLAIKHIWEICIVAGAFTGISSYFYFTNRISLSIVFAILSLPAILIELTVAIYCWLQFSRK
jgi:hypothetical protein